MTKSTPLSELPRMGNVDVAQARQNNIPSLPLPVNTSIENDINEDNDETIMEALRQLPGGDPPSVSSNPNPMMNMVPQPSIPSVGRSTIIDNNFQNRGMTTQEENKKEREIQMQMQMQMHAKMELEKERERERERERGRESERMRLQEREANEHYTSQEPDESIVHQDINDNESHFEEEVNTRKNIFKRGLRDVFHEQSEFKRMVIVMIVFIISTLIPINALLSKYIAQEKLPFALIVARAVLAGVLYFALMRLL